MSAPVNPPELIISLSRDKVRVQLLDMDGSGKAPWQSTFPIQGVFLEDQISAALDLALNQNPDLLDHFERVEVVVLDRPNLCVPQHYGQNEQLAEIAAKYLRLRVGDFLASDSTSNKTLIAYTLPIDTIQTIQEYYANAGHLHITSLLWTTLTKRENDLSDVRSRLFFNLLGNTLWVMGECAGKLTFCKNFIIQTQDDLVYYAVSCSRLLRHEENWFVTLRNESPLFEIPRESYFTIQHHLEIPELPDLIALHRLCES